jgi:hypothetical protein
MQTFYGIVASSSGQYTMASIKIEKNAVVNCSIKHWNCDDKIKTALLLHRGVVCGLPSTWKSKKSYASQDTRTAEGTDKSFLPSVARADYDFHQTTLQNNCIAIVPDDAFLSALPLSIADPLIHSFISVYPQKTHFEIGITIDRELIAVFKMSPGSPNALEGHLRRIQLYFSCVRPPLSFPDHIYLIGKIEHSSDFSLHSLSVTIAGKKFENDDEIRALGVALSQGVGTIVPRFSGPKARSDLRYARTGLYAASMALVIAAVIFTGAGMVANRRATLKISAYESHYQTTISNNRNVRNLLNENDTLAKAILRSSNKNAAKTEWGAFLAQLGSQRPSGLYCELLGSEPIKGSPGSMRIAVSGWARSEKLAADFIARLQKNNRISNITLSSMEKNAKKPDICDFKILCILKIADL